MQADSFQPRGVGADDWQLVVGNDRLVLVYSARPAIVDCWECNAVRPRWTFTDVTRILEVFHHDNKVFVVTETPETNTVFVLSAADGTVRKTIRTSRTAEFAGGHFYFVGRVNETHHLMRIDEDGNTNVVAAMNPDRSHFSISEDGNKVVFATTKLNRRGEFMNRLTVSDGNVETAHYPRDSIAQLHVANTGRFIEDGYSYATVYSSVENIIDNLPSLEAEYSQISANGNFVLISFQNAAYLYAVVDNKTEAFRIRGSRATMSTDGRYLAFFRDGRIVVILNPFLKPHAAISVLESPAFLARFPNYARETGDHAVFERISKFLW